MVKTHGILMTRYFVRKTRRWWRLYVAIADVAHYVAVDSPLDREAQTARQFGLFSRLCCPHVAGGFYLMACVP